MVTMVVVLVISTETSVKGEHMIGDKVLEKNKNEDYACGLCIVLFRLRVKLTHKDLTLRISQIYF